ncbi:LLM class F420-dependent oxidoreductase [Mycolicibacterium litorale]|uniref:LLM class F420-dependent oxidoreductase n=2 Tax=Mycolicibacterium litorale TaxID=758802 RepID=A0AAD1IPE5_9MYCO|nr:LLM class F420-dependent oxidoreductase [Mycolicibacterium litorale]TDY06374.1 putative F420-dependent oxidoreductase [Mycolicibacterium litorale]BBY19480.1 LLM class F420-dependent oxidoreductase [Mycolicibacterium litorale]
MKFGVSTFLTDEGLRPDELAVALEERGFDSLFVSEHTHYPVAAPPPPDTDLPQRDYLRSLDPFIALSAAAMVTDRLTLGTGITLVVQRDPLTLAKEVATLDYLSGGRLQLGVGAGWLREEMVNHGTNPKTRMALMRERVLAMKQIWTQEQAEFHGEYVSFDPVYSWPKPTQRPHVPVLVGGNGPTVFNRVLEYGDGWAPNLPSTPEDLVADVAELRRRGDDQGRSYIPVTLIGADQRGFRGTERLNAIAPLNKHELATLAEGGIDHCLFFRNAALSSAEALRYLDDLVELTEEFRGGADYAPAAS